MSGKPALPEFRVAVYCRACQQEFLIKSTRVREVVCPVCGAVYQLVKG